MACIQNHSNKPTTGRKLLALTACSLKEYMNSFSFLLPILSTSSWAHGWRSCHLIIRHRNSAKYMLFRQHIIRVEPMADEVAICLPIIKTLLNICSSTTYNQSFSSLGINLSSWPVLMPVTTLRKNFYAENLSFLLVRVVACVQIYSLNPQSVETSNTNSRLRSRDGLQLINESPFSWEMDRAWGLASASVINRSLTHQE